MALRVWLPLNGNLENQGLSGYSLKTMGTGIVFNTNGKIGESVTFPNSPANCLYIDGGLKMQNLTWTCWFKSLGAGSGTSQRILSEGRDTGNRGVEIWLSKDGLTLNAFARGKGLSTSTTIDTWHHVALVAGDAEVSLYLDGTLINTVSPTAANDYAQSSNAFVIGKMSYSYTTTTNYFPFNGYINDVRVYDECLSLKQIKEISKGLVAHYKLTGVGANPNLAKNTNTDSLSTNAAYYHEATGGHTRSLEYDENGVPCICFVRNDTAHSGWQYLSYDNFDRAAITTNTTYTVSVDIKASVDGSLSLTGLLNGNATNYMTNSSTTIKGTILANKWNHLVFTCTTISDFSSITVGSQVIYWSMSNSLLGTGVSLWIKNVKLEKGSVETDYIPNVNDTKYSSLGYENNICTDVSGYEHTATKSGTLVFNSDSPRYEGGTKFNAGYLHKIPSPLHVNSDAFTISCWFYPTASGTQAIINDRKSVGDGLSVFYYTGTQMRFDTGSSYQWVVSASDFGLNQWNFLTFVWDKNEGIKKYYLNGNLINSTTSYGTIANIGDVYSIGNSSTNGAAGAGNQVYGSISDFRVYSTALSDEDIKELYQTSAIVDNQGNSYAYEFKEE